VSGEGRSRQDVGFKKLKRKVYRQVMGHSGIKIGEI